MSSTRIAVLMTCHNRRDKTLACLEALYGQQLPDGVSVKAYLVDDGCTDGTGQAVRQRFPETIILEGNGQLFWCGGMRRAFEKAMEEDYDQYLWLNDDTILNRSALATLLKAYERVAGDSLKHIMVGSVVDPANGKLSYGGVVRSSRWHPFHYRIVEPNEIPTPCETMNGNCVMVSRQAARAVGNMDASFVHGFADYDYGLRAGRQGCRVWIAPGVIGSCLRNPERLKWRDASVPRRERWAYLMSVKGLPPRQMLTYARRYGGALWPVFWCVPYLRALFFPVKHASPVSAAPAENERPS